MRHPRILFVLLAFITVLSSCKTNNDVVSNGILQKRKHLSGFHWSGAKQVVHKNHVPGIASHSTRPLEQMNSTKEELRLPATVNTQQLPSRQSIQPTLIASKDESAMGSVLHDHFHAKAATMDQQWVPESWEKADFKKRSAVKKRSGWALFLSLMGSILFAFLAANFFVGLLSSGVLALTLLQLALLLGGLLLGWKHKNTNKASKAAFILSWIFLGLTGLFYFGLIVLGMF